VTWETQFQEVRACLA